jgi:excisionase family DNA binding protein
MPRKIQPPAEGERLLSPGEVAALFRVDSRTVSRWADAKRIDAIKTPGGHWRFRNAVIQALLRGEAEGGGPS